MIEVGSKFYYRAVNGVDTDGNPYSLEGKDVVWTVSGGSLEVSPDDKRLCLVTWTSISSDENQCYVEATCEGVTVRYDEHVDPKTPKLASFEIVREEFNG